MTVVGTDRDKMKDRFYAYKNLVVVSVVFLLVFLSFDSLQIIQTSIHTDPSLGFASLCTIYAMFCLSSLFLPTLLINGAGYKYAMFITIFGYITYTLAHFYPKWWMHITASVIVGLCAAPLWAAQSSYVVDIANEYADKINASAEGMISKFFCIFYLIKTFGLIAGNAVSSLILKPVHNENKTKNPSEICGANFTPDSLLTQDTQNVESRPVNMLIGIYVAGMILAVAILFFFLDRIQKKKENISICNQAVLTLKLMKNTRMQLLVPLAMLYGLEQAFMFGDFTKAFVTCNIGIEMVGFTLICFGVTSVLVSFLLGAIVKYTGTCILMIIAFFIHMGLILFLLFFPLGDSPTLWLFLTSGIWGICDIIWGTQINAIYGIMFPKNTVEALALYKLFQSLGSVIAFGYGNVISIKLKFYILIGVLVVAMVLYLIVEFRRRRDEKEDREVREEMLYLN